MTTMAAIYGPWKVVEHSIASGADMLNVQDAMAIDQAQYCDLTGIYVGSLKECRQHSLAELTKLRGMELVPIAEGADIYVRGG